MAAFPIDGDIASGAQQALATHRAGKSIESCEQYQALFGLIGQRYTADQISSNASVACILADFGRACAAVAKVGEADSLFASAYKILLHTVSESHPVSMRTLGDWIRFKWESDSFTEDAQAALARIYSAQDTGGLHDDLASTLHTMALTKIASLGLDEALGLLERARALCEQSEAPLTRTHVQAEIECTVATVLRDKGQCAAAEACVARAFVLLEASPFMEQDFSVAAPDHPLTAALHLTRVSIAAHAGRFAAALEPVRESLRVYRKYLPLTHPHVLRAEAWEALVLAANSFFATCLSNKDSILAVADASHFTDVAAEALFLLAMVQDAAGSYQDAFQTISKARTLLLSRAPRSLLFLRVLCRVARLELVLAHYAASQDTLAVATALCDTASVPLPDQVLVHCERARLLAKSSKFDEAAAVFAAIEARDRSLAHRTVPNLSLASLSASTLVHSTHNTTSAAPDADTLLARDTPTAAPVGKASGPVDLLSSLDGLNFGSAPSTLPSGLLAALASGSAPTGPVAPPLLSLGPDPTPTLAAASVLPTTSAAAPSAALDLLGVFDSTPHPPAPLSSSSSAVTSPPPLSGFSLAAHPPVYWYYLLCRFSYAFQLCEFATCLRVAEVHLQALAPLGDRHPDTAYVLHERAKVHHALAHYGLARKGHELAYSIMEEKLPADHPWAASVSQSIGLALSAGAGFAEAQERYCRAMQLRGIAFGTVHPAVADTLGSLAAIERMQGHVDEALALMDQALSIRRSAYGSENHLDVAAAMIQQGELQCIMCKYEEAKEIFADALVIQRRLLGPRRHLDIARALLGTVSVQFALGEYTAALPLVDEATETRLALLGNEHPDYANCLQHRARVVFVQGQYVEALRLHEQALVILEGSLGPDHPDVASAAQHVGVSCQFVMTIPPPARSAKADANLSRALAIRRGRFGDQHPSVAETLGCLGSLRRGQGKIDEARRYLEQSLAIRRRIQPIHMDVARGLLSLGNLLCQQSKHAEAKVCFEEALDIAKSIVDTADHPDVARIMTGLAATHEAAGRLREAEMCLQSALRMQQTCLGPQHRETSSSYHNLSLILRSQGRTLEALKLCEQALAQMEARLGPVHPDVARALNSLAELQRAQQHFDKAVELYSRSLAIIEQTLGPTDVQFAEALNNLANVHSDCHKHETAVPLYRRAIAVQKEVHGPQHRHVAITLRNLGINLQELGQNTEALQAYQEAYTILVAALGASHRECKELKRVISYLRGDPITEALSSALTRLKSIKLNPRSLLPSRKKPKTKLKLLEHEVTPTAPPTTAADDDDDDEMLEDAQQIR